MDELGTESFTGLSFPLCRLSLPACVGSSSSSVGFIFPLVWALLGLSPLGRGTQKEKKRKKHIE